MGIANLVQSVGKLHSNNNPNTNIANIIDFVESAWGLNVQLYPVQRVILKAYYGIPLDDKKEFEVHNWQWTTFTKYTEASYLKYLYDTGKANIDKVLPGDDRTEMVLAVGRRSGKCILGDSLVLTDKGIYRIDELGNKNGPEVQPLERTIAQEGFETRSKSKYFYNGGVRQTRTLTTYCGYQLGGTDNHRIKVLTEQGVVDWRYLADLKVNDMVCIHRDTDLWASDYVDCTLFFNKEGHKDLVFPEKLTEDWGLLLGYLVGDGSWTVRTRVEVTVELPETWDSLKALFFKLLGSFKVKMDKRTKNTGNLQFFSTGMRKFLHNLGFQLGTARDAKMVPWSIMQSPRSVVQAFLRGLFETDGGVEADGKTVSFSTASRRLAKEVQILLLNFGVISRIKPKLVKGRVYWILSVRGLRSRDTFAKLIGFDSKKKMEPLLVSLRRATREGGDTESIPYQRPWVKQLLESVPKFSPGRGWNRSILRGVLGNSIKPSSEEDFTYPRWLKVLPVAEQLHADPEIIQHFKTLQKSDYFFDPVTRIEESQSPVYDLNVPEGESFVANGMTNHNTLLAAMIASYETYKLIKKGNPQEYYGISPSANIQIVSVATDKEQAGILYQEASGYFRGCGFFSKYTANNTMSYARFQTPNDQHKFGVYADDNSAKATIKVTFRSCIAKGLRGPGNMVIILDEIAHFSDQGQSSAEAVYKSITPSTATFTRKDANKNPVGPGEGRVISISSPLGRQGMLFQLFQKGWTTSGQANMLCIQAPTWEVNPSLPPSELEKHYMKDPTSFMTEFGADFTDRTRGWIESASDLVQCIDPAQRPTSVVPARRPHFIGIDLGLVTDGTAIAIGHINEEKKIVVDLVDQIKAGEGDFLKDERLDFDDVADWILKLSKRFYFAKGMFDQWSGIPFEQALAKRGLRQLESEPMTKNKNSEIYRNFKDMMWDRKLILYNWPIQPGKVYCSYIEELLELQAEYQSKYITLVYAPNMEGKHDDRSDALVRMVWLASQHLTMPKYISGQGPSSPSARSNIHQSESSYRKAFSQLRRTGSSPDRQKSRTNPGRVMGRR